ncbi:MAG: aminotransferase class V-fold PLP-dependent enzyme [Gemmatimonadaceae bacterium]
MTADRRTFLASMGALSLAGLLPAPAAGATRGGPAVPRGLAAADDFLFEPGLAYLQTGSLGPTPRPVMDRTIAVWRELELNPAAKGYGPLETAMDEVRARAAAFIGCATDELVLTNCTTEGMNWIAQGLHLAPGDRVLTTDQEHPGGRVCWDYLVRTRGIELDVVAIPPGENDAPAIIRRFEQAILPRTRVFSFSHLLSSTGLRMPVAELSALARAHGCLSVVDGAQAVGAVDVDVKQLGCHAYATSGHKWLLAPKGTGLLYLSAELGGRIDPIALQSGRGAYTAASGVCSIPSVHGLAAAVEYQMRIGKGAIEQHNLALRAQLLAALASVPQVRVVSPAAGPLASPLLTYVLPDRVKAGELHARLRDKHRVEVKVVPGQWLNGQRISTHLFNTPRDIEALVTALMAELA